MAVKEHTAIHGTDCLFLSSEAPWKRFENKSSIPIIVKIETKY